MGKTSSRPDEQPEPQSDCGATARFAAGTLISHRVAALPILDRLLTGSASRRSSATICPARIALPCPHRDRPPDPAQEPPDLPRAPLRRRRVGRAARPRAARIDPGATPLAQRRPRRPLPRPPLRRRHPLAHPRRRAHAVREFAVDLDELHNDSTTITLHGDYEAADHERTLRGNSDWPSLTATTRTSPDLKQILYILTVSRDGAVPVHFRVESGNATDDRSHIATWKSLTEV